MIGHGIITCSIVLMVQPFEHNSSYFMRAITQQKIKPILIYCAIGAH